MNRTPVVIGLLAVNTLVFLLLQQSMSHWVELLALWPAGAALTTQSLYESHFRIWQLLSHGFLHGSFLHLFLNMYALWLFGKPLETSLGSQRFLVFYLACIAGAALFHLLVQQIMIQQGVSPQPVIGASGGTFGLLMAFAYYYPNTQLYLLIPPLPVKAKWFVLAYGIVELVFGVTGTVNGIAHFAHLGGMLTAYLLVRFWFASAR